MNTLAAGGGSNGLTETGASAAGCEGWSKGSFAHLAFDETESYLSIVGFGRYQPMHPKVYRARCGLEMGVAHASLHNPCKPLADVKQLSGPEKITRQLPREPTDWMQVRRTVGRV
jgi:hypothetical protein